MSSELFKFAIYAWEAYSGARKGEYASTVDWPVNKLESLYADYFGTPLQPSDSGTVGLEWLLYTVPIFEVGETGFLSVSKEKLVKFIVYPAVGIDRVDEEHFRENIVKATGLEVEQVYKLFNTVTFTDFVQYLTFQCPLFHTTRTSSGRLLLHMSPDHFFEHTARHPVYPGYTPPKSKTSHKDITPLQTSLPRDKSSLPSPPKNKKKRKDCVTPTTISSWSQSGRPISVRLLSDHVSEQQESYVSFSDPTSAYRVTENCKSKKKKHKRKRKASIQHI